MNIVFFLKPISDILYEYRLLDILLSSFCFILLFQKKKEIDFCNIDLCVFILSILYLFSFLRNTLGFITFIKIISSFMLYFSGRLYSDKWEQNVTYIQNGLFITFLISLYSLVSGSGFQMWGNIRTFSSYYYFKTDLATTMAQTFLIFSILPRIKKWHIGVLLGCSIMIFLSNTRMYYFIWVFLIGIYGLYYREYKFRKRMKFKWTTILYVILLVLAILYFLNYLGTTSLGDKFLLFNFDKVSDLYDSRNMQGRNVAWESILHYFNQQNFLTRFFGIDLVRDSVIGGINAHNLYLKILFSIGYLGSTIFCVFITLAFKQINKVKESRLFYITSGLLSIYLLGGFSYITIESTQITWLPMFFLGVIVSRNQKILKRKK